MEEHQLPDVRSRSSENARVFVILGWVFTGLTVLLSWFSMVVAIIMGILAIVRGAKKQGIWIIVVSVLLAIAMTVFYVTLFAWLGHQAPTPSGMTP